MENKQRMALVVPDVEAVKGELALVEPTVLHVDPVRDKELVAQAEQFVAVLMEHDPADIKGQDEKKLAVEAMGQRLQREAAQKSQMLQTPIKTLSQRSADGGEVANALIGLKLQVEELDPAEVNFSPGWFTRFIGLLPFIGVPAKRYFSRYESAQTVIDAVVQSLEKGQGQLRRDNTTLLNDQGFMREMTVRLEKQVKLGMIIDKRIEEKLGTEVEETDPKHRFIQDELQFPLRQRIQDLQQQLVVNQQGVFAVALIMENNNQLIRGVNRAIDVTVTALRVAVTVALALANQKLVLDKIHALNAVTDNMIAATSRRLRTQGVEVHKLASSTQLQVSTLQQSFQDITDAMDDISKFRREALPKMAQTILDLDKLTGQGEEAMQRLEQGRRLRPTLEIEVV